ncbi:Carboxypeptidase SOL1 [Sesamum angolense]|uniref:Carboxypeptidase SOL1 n=1 Tax=Sesamum angolense TaxID=2727404 RepID=A0AAE1T7K7_9LAMI|nr:Carboxypeptidase SOL1 [Sesamum angolense]
MENTPSMILSLLFLSLNLSSLFHSSIARGGGAAAGLPQSDRLDYVDRSYDRSARRLFSEDYFQMENLAQGYMSNSELEKAMKELNGRCSNISRIYRKNYYECPDDETFRYLASLYSRSHYNMSLSKEFPGGITNGAFWYPIYGGMQD